MKLLEQPPSRSLNESHKYQTVAWQLPGRERMTGRDEKGLASLHRTGKADAPQGALEARENLQLLMINFLLQKLCL